MTALLILGLILAGSFALAYVLGKWLGKWSTAACLTLSLLPLAWSLFQLARVTGSEAAGMAFLVLLVSLSCSVGCALAYWLVCRRKLVTESESVGFTPS